MGHLMCLGAKDSCEFFHDPFKGRRYIYILLSSCFQDLISMPFINDMGMNFLCLHWWLIFVCLNVRIFFHCFSDEGRVRKVLKIDPMPDGSGHFFNLSNSSFLRSFWFVHFKDISSVSTCYLIFLEFLYTEGVQNKLINVDENIYIPVAKAEFAVLNSTFNVRSLQSPYIYILFLHLFHLHLHHSLFSLRITSGVFQYI